MNESLPPAKLTDRFLAYLFDLIPFIVGYYGTLYLFIVKLQKWPYSQAAMQKAFIAWLLLYIVYQTLGNLAGATIGKSMFGIRVCRTDGQPLTPAQALLRGVGYLISSPLMNLGFLWSFFQAQSRTWHDLLAGSIVVEDRQKSQGAALFSAVVSLLVFVAIMAGNAWFYLLQPSPMDHEAIRKAHGGLQVLGAIQEAHKRKTGNYTQRLGDLAATSGDLVRFRQSMAKIFEPNGFILEAGASSYLIQARAKDRRHTIVVIEGP
ncbi:MAG: hypothetical protein COB53_10325 [Elusimicrobia bacterium]|nr:MAG: hypothetical protein COB53_10325 [Elusimicrobiota bacterium]